MPMLSVMSVLNRMEMKMSEPFTLKHLESDGPWYPWHRVAKPVCPRCGGAIPMGEGKGGSVPGVRLP